MEEWAILAADWSARRQAPPTRDPGRGGGGAPLAGRLGAGRQTDILARPAAPSRSDGGRGSRRFHTSQCQSVVGTLSAVSSGSNQSWAVGGSWCNQPATAAISGPTSEFPAVAETRWQDRVFSDIHSRERRPERTRAGKGARKKEGQEKSRGPEGDWEFRREGT